MMNEYSKLIGKKDLFAIQFKIEEVRNPYIWGHICYWINSMMIGNFESVTILSDVFIFLPHIIYDNGNREHESFYKMDKDKVFYLLSGQAFLNNHKYEEIALTETWARFSIEMGLDVFVGTVVKLIEDKDNARIIFSSDGKEVYDLYLKKGNVEDVFTCFSVQFNAIYDSIS